MRITTLIIAAWLADVAVSVILIGSVAYTAVHLIAEFR